MALLLLVVLVLAPAAAGVSAEGGGEERTYIVRVDADARPSVYPTNAHWYEAAVLAASSGDGEWPEGGPLIHTYSAAFHGFSARMTPAAADALSSAPGVSAVVPERVRRLATTRSPGFLGLLSSPPSALLADSDFGADLVIAVLDTGISPSHRSFHDRGLGPVPPRLPARLLHAQARRRALLLRGVRGHVRPHERVRGGPVPARHRRARDPHGLHRRGAVRWCTAARRRPRPTMGTPPPCAWTARWTRPRCAAGSWCATAA
jgi:hypothetical protein